jgi:hypothetical protein
VHGSRTWGGRGDSAPLARVSQLHRALDLRCQEDRMVTSSMVRDISDAVTIDEAGMHRRRQSGLHCLVAESCSGTLGRHGSDAKHEACIHAALHNIAQNAIYRAMLIKG